MPRQLPFSFNFIFGERDKVIKGVSTDGMQQPSHCFLSKTGRCEQPHCHDTTAKCSWPQLWFFLSHIFSQALQNTAKFTILPKGTNCHWMMPFNIKKKIPYICFLLCSGPDVPSLVLVNVGSYIVTGVALVPNRSCKPKFHWLWWSFGTCEPSYENQSTHQDTTAFDQVSSVCQELGDKLCSNITHIQTFHKDLPADSIIDSSHVRVWRIVQQWILWMSS